MADDNDNEPSINIVLELVIIGNLSVGKYSIITRYLNNKFEQEDAPILHNGPEMMVISIDGVKCILKINETQPDHCDNILSLNPLSNSSFLKYLHIIIHIDEKTSICRIPIETGLAYIFIHIISINVWKNGCQLLKCPVAI